MSKPLKKFIESRKSYSINPLNKSDISCPDCGNILFKSAEWVGCFCYGGLKDGITLKKTESGVKIEFSPAWDVDNIEMLLQFLRNKNK